MKMPLGWRYIIVARMLDLLLVSTTHRKRLLRWSLEGPYVILQSSPGKIGPGNVQFELPGTTPLPLPSMMVTDLTVTGLVPTFATLHSPPPSPSPVEITAAWAVPPRIIPARAVHTLRDIGLLLIRVVSQEPPRARYLRPLHLGRPEARMAAPGHPVSRVIVYRQDKSQVGDR